MSYNKVILIGNLTRDVELKYLPAGTAAATIGLAVNRKYKDSAGIAKEEVCFVDVQLYGRNAEIANQYLRKGSRVMIDGRLKYESWKDQAGITRSKHVVVAEVMRMMGSTGGAPSAPNAETGPKVVYQGKDDGESLPV